MGISPATATVPRIETGRPPEAAAAEPGALVFHAGTQRRSGGIVAAGGRVLTVVGRGASYRDAIDVAYRAASHIHFDGMQYRRDIGRRAVLATSGAS